GELYEMGCGDFDTESGVLAEGGYRYGFQDQERDREIFRSGSINYKYRMHRPDLGRFFSVDPLFREYPWNSTYAFSENRVTNAIELEGLEAWDLNGGVTVYGPFTHRGEAHAAAMSGGAELYVKLPEIEIVDFQTVNLAQGEDNMGILRSGRGSI